MCVWLLMLSAGGFDWGGGLAFHASAGEVFNRKGGTGRVEVYV